MNALKSLTVLPASFEASFGCDRTCPAHRTHWCRFNALFRRLGSARVHSHTVKIKVAYTDVDLLKKSCDSLGWKWLGLKDHSLFDGNYTGHGFKPEGWEFPAIFDAATCELRADTFNGQWGDDRKLDLLKSEYAMQTAINAAIDLGWQSERTDAGLVVYHPDGGQLTISKEGICETTGFIGAGCHAAREALHLAADGLAQNKPEYSQTAAQVQAGN
jgi:hypothetical protein